MEGTYIRMAHITWGTYIDAEAPIHGRRYTKVETTKNKYIGMEKAYIHT